MATLTDNKNYLQPTGFAVSIEKTNYPNLQYFAQSVTHPGASVNPIELPGRRISALPFAGDKITYTELSIDFILDEDMASYQEMQAWLERMVNEGNITKAQALADNTVSTFADITLSILTSHNNPNKRIRYFNCIPTNIGSIELNATQNQTYLTYTASFRFDTFELI